MIAPISGQSLGLQKAQVTNGVRELTLCKDKDNKVITFLSYHTNCILMLNKLLLDWSTC